MPRTALSRRKLPDYTRGEEVFNSVSHIVGGVLSIVAFVVCLAISISHGSAWSVFSGVVYTASLIILYTNSGLYHGLKHIGAKKVFQILDHCAIFLLIAGTYTPFILCIMRETHPWLTLSMMILIWGCALVGIILNAIDLKKFAKFSMISYLGMGWSVILVIRPIIKLFPLPGLVLVAIGGFFYTLGAALYGLGKKHHYMHGVFHVFVLVGSITHFFAVVLYCLPLG